MDQQTVVVVVAVDRVGRPALGLSTRSTAQGAKACSLISAYGCLTILDTFRDYLIRSLESLDILIQVVQRMKDMVQLIVNASDSSLDSESAMNSISEIRESLFTCYEERLPDLQNEETRGAHKAKDYALTIEMRLRDCLDGTKWVSEMTDEQKRTLIKFRNELSDAQDLLRDSRAKKLIKRIGLF